MGMYWTCPTCGAISSHDDFGPEDDETCSKCYKLLRGGYVEREEREPYMDAAALRLEAELDDIAMHEEYEERFNDREEYTFQRDWNLP